MPFEKKTWKNENDPTLVKGVDPAIDADNMNRIEQGIVDAHTHAEDTDQHLADGERAKLAGIEPGAEVNPTASEMLGAIKTVDGAGSGLDADTVDGVQGADIIVEGDTRLTDARTPLSHTHPAAEVTDFDTEVSNNADVAANTAARHSNANDPTAMQKAAMNAASLPSAVNPFATANDLAELGTGDMSKSVYDTDGDGKVNSAVAADTVPWTGVGSKPNYYPPEPHVHTEAEISDLGNYEPAFAKKTAFNKDFGSTADTVVQGNDARLSDSRVPVLHGNEAHSAAYVDSTAVSSAISTHASDVDAHHSNVNDPTAAQKAALDAAASPSALNPFATVDDISAAGGGDMLKSTYDSDGDGKVNSAEAADAVPWTGVTGRPATYAPEPHSHTEAEISDLGSYIPASEKSATNGIPVLDANAKVPLAQLPDVTKLQTYVVNDINARDALTDLVSGEKCYILPSDPENGGNSYIYDGTQWQILASADWENVNLDWTNIANPPATYEPAPHNHTEAEISDFGNYEPAFTKNGAFNKNFGTAAGTVCEGNDARLSDVAANTAHRSDTNNPHGVTAAQVGLGNLVNELQTVAKSGGKHIWVQATQPTAVDVGDIWIQTQ